MNTALFPKPRACASPPTIRRGAPLPNSASGRGGGITNDGWRRPAFLSYLCEPQGAGFGEICIRPIPYPAKRSLASRARAVVVKNGKNEGTGVKGREHRTRQPPDNTRPDKIISSPRTLKAPGPNSKYLTYYIKRVMGNGVQMREG